MRKITIELVSKISKIFLIVVGSMMVLYMFLLITGNLEKVETEEGIKTFSGSIVSYTSQLYVFVLIVLTISIVSVIGFALAQILSDFRRLKSMLIKVVLPILLVFILSYSLSSSTPVKFINGNLSTEGESKWSEMGIITVYIFFASAIILAFAGTLINKLVKK